MSEQGLGRRRARALARSQCPGLHRPFELTQIASGQSNPTTGLPPRRAAMSSAANRSASCCPLPTRSTGEYRCFRRSTRSISRVPRPLACALTPSDRRDFLCHGSGPGRPYANGALPEFDPPTGNGCPSSWSTSSPTSPASIRKRPELGDFGKPGNYFERQIARWTAVSRLADRLHYRDGAADFVPAGDTPGAGEDIDRPWRLPDRQCRVRRRRDIDAVLDWELATLETARRFFLFSDAVDDARPTVRQD